MSIVSPVVVDVPRRGEDHMRQDAAALARQAAPGARPEARIYRWAEPTVSVGRLIPHPLAHDYARRTGARALAARPTGGGLVYHTDDVSLSVAWRPDSGVLPARPREAYRVIHGLVAAALHDVGVAGSLWAGEEPRPGGATPKDRLCFSTAGWAEGDVIHQGVKVAGGALRCAAGARLYQGTIRAGVCPARLEESLKAVFLNVLQQQNIPQ